MMSVKYTVFYESTSLSIIRHVDGEVLRYSLKSSELTHRIEESKAFIKDVTESSFLHSPEFEHYVCSGYTVSLPASIFDTNFVKDYFERVHGTFEAEPILEHASLNHQKVIHIYNVPLWTKSFLENTFSKPNSPTLFEYLIQSMELYSQRKVVVFLFVSESAIHVVLQKNGDLRFIDSIPFDTLEDIVYHLLNLLTKNKATEDPGVLLLQSIHAGHSPETIQHLMSQMANFNTLEVVVKKYQKPVMP